MPYPVRILYTRCPQRSGLTVNSFPIKKFAKPKLPRQILLSFLDSAHFLISWKDINSLQKIAYKLLFNKNRRFSLIPKKHKNYFSQACVLESFENPSPNQEGENVQAYILFLPGITSIGRIDANLDYISCDFYVKEAMIG